MKYLFIFILLTFALEADAQWQNAQFMNPGAIGQLDTDVFVTCTNPSGGVWRHNPSDPYFSQLSWIGTSGIFGGDPILSFFTLGPYDFVGTTEGNIYRSSDVGKDWAIVGEGLPFIPSVTGFAFLDSSLFMSTTRIGSIWRSNDSGIHWTESDTGLSNTVTALATIGTNIFSGGGGGVYRSTDGGHHWVTTGFPTGNVACLAIVGTNIFVGVYGGGVYRSIDSGGHWTTVNSGMTDLAVKGLVTDGKNLFVAGESQGVFVSTNNGESWDSSNTGFMRDAENHYEITTIGVFDSTLFAASTEDGIGELKMRPISEMVKDTTSGVVAQPLASDSIVIYPNPSSGIVTVFGENTPIFGVSVVNVLGEAILTSNARPDANGAFSFDLTSKAAGTYYVEIRTNTGISLKKITIVK